MINIDVSVKNIYAKKLCLELCYTTCNCENI